MKEQLHPEIGIGVPQSELEPGSTLGYLEPVGNFTHEVAVDIQGWDRFANSTLIGAKSIAKVVEMVTTGIVDYAVVPIENSTDGHIPDMVKALIEEDDITIVGETTKPIKLYYYMRQDAEPKVIRSKDTVENQARQHLEELFPGLPFVKTDSTALSVRMAAEDPTVIGIGSENAAIAQNIEHLVIRSKDSIEDNPNNATTFVVIRKGKEKTPITGEDKTSFIISIPDREGSLYRILEDLDEKGINLNKIKSLKKMDGQVLFLMSVDGHESEPNMAEALLDLEKKIPIKRLGSYKKAVYEKPEFSEPDIQTAVGRIRDAQNGNANLENQTTVVFTLPDLRGALKKAIEPFAKNHVNLVEIDSQASGNAHEYIFSLVFEIHIPNREEILDQLAANCAYMQVVE